MGCHVDILKQNIVMITKSKRFGFNQWEYVLSWKRKASLTTILYKCHEELTDAS